MKSFISVIRADFKNIIRDEVLPGMPFIPVLIGLLLRFGVPRLTILLSDYLDLSEYYSFISGFFLVLCPMFTGWIFGFLLLDEKDQHVLAVIRCTPIGNRRFILYRFIFAIVFSAVLSSALLLIAGLTPFHAAYTLPVILLASLEAPLFALFLAAFAENKIQGLALGKIGGFLFLGPFVTLFVQSFWHLLGGLSPAYWVTQAYIFGMQNAELYFVYLGSGFIYHILIGSILMKNFTRNIR